MFNNERVCCRLCDFNAEGTAIQKMHSLLKGKLMKPIQLKPFSQQFNLLETHRMGHCSEISEIIILYKYQAILVTSGSKLLLFDYYTKKLKQTIILENLVNDNLSILCVIVDQGKEEFLYLLAADFYEFTKCKLCKYYLAQLINKSGSDESLMWNNNTLASEFDDDWIQRTKLELKEENDSIQYIYMMNYNDGLFVFRGTDGKLIKQFPYLEYNHFVKFNEKDEMFASRYFGAAIFTYCPEEGFWKERATDYWPQYTMIDGVYFEKSSKLIYTNEDSERIAWYDEHLRGGRKKLLYTIICMTIDERRGELYVITRDGYLNIYN